MEIRIERYDYRVFLSRPGEYLFVGGPGHLNLARMSAVVPNCRKSVAASRGTPWSNTTRNAVLSIKPRSSRWRCPLGWRRRKPVLLHIFRRQLRIVPEQIAPVRIEGNRFNDTPNGEPYSANTRLAVHLARVPSDSIEAAHSLYLHTCGDEIGDRYAAARPYSKRAGSSDRK
jgi:hypothetical protein